MQKATLLMNKITGFIFFLAAVMLSSTVLPIQAATWSEVGEAGATPSTLQVPSGTGSLTTITGTLSAAADIDMYRINITDRTIFQAAIASQVFGNDPDIWLFDTNGFGISLNSCVAAGQTLVTGTFVPSNGDYFLAISSGGADAVSAGGNIWISSQVLVSERAPDGAGASQAFLSWGGSPALTKSSYTIQLQGAGFSPVPEPSTWAMMVTGCASLLLFRRCR